MIRA
jgi:hypothetical protein